jgi:hypothetical protein
MRHRRTVVCRSAVGLAAALLASTKLFAAETLHFALHIAPAMLRGCTSSTPG